MSRGTIFLVDDEAAQRRAMSRLLGAHDLEVRTDRPYPIGCLTAILVPGGVRRRLDLAPQSLRMTRIDPES